MATEQQIGDREKLRAERKLRIVTGDEEGRSLEFQPGGVYGFTYSPVTEGTPLFARQTKQVFEVHRLANESTHFLGYMTEQDEQKLRTSNEMVELKLYPDPHGDATRFVSVDRDQIARAKPVSRDNGNYLPFLLAAD